MEATQVFQRYQRLQRYVGWTDEDAERIRSMADLVRPAFPPLVDDFYDTIRREPEAVKVITGGEEQIARLKVTLRGWLEELFSAKYDADYVMRRWKVGWRHVEIGLDQVYTNVALSRLRSGLIDRVGREWSGDAGELKVCLRSLNMLLDLDLAIIEDAYQTEHLLRHQRAERLAVIGQVAAGVAHELRNPLNVIKTSAYYLLNARNPSEEKTRSHLERINRQVNAADSVITALSNFAKLPVPELRPVPVEPCLREVVELSTVPEAICVTIDCEAGLPAMMGDPQQLQVVLSNLVRNACDAMPEGGCLSLTGRRNDRNVDIAVADTGMGIEPEKLSRITEPLYSTKARGIGLGLAIARAILDKHNATLHVESDVGMGTTFTVSLAAAAQDGE